MSVFMINISSADNADKMEQLLLTKYGAENFVQISPSAWLFEDKVSVTPQQVCTVLELIEPANVSPFYGYLVSAFTGYWGFQESDVWQWLRLRGL